MSYSANHVPRKQLRPISEMHSALRAQGLTAGHAPHRADRSLTFAKNDKQRSSIGKQICPASSKRQGAHELNFLLEPSKAARLRARSSPDWRTEDSSALKVRL